jgi:UDP-N-acetylglucosamine 2-epimerase
LLRDREHYEAMSRPSNAFGDGTASAQIAAILRGWTGRT